MQLHVPAKKQTAPKAQGGGCSSYNCDNVKYADVSIKDQGDFKK